MKRDQLLEKIRNLLAKTEDVGCSEEEAMSAAAKASEFMVKYEVSRSELDVREDKYGKLTKSFTRSADSTRLHPVGLFCCMAVADFTDTRTWVVKGEGTITFFGAYADTQIAYHLLDLLKNVADKGVAEYLESDERDPYVHGRTATASWFRGFTRRVSSRLYDLKEKQVEQITTEQAVKDEFSEQPSTGTSLMVVKKEMVQEAFEAAGIKVIAGDGDDFQSNRSAHLAGRDAGDNVNLSRGVSDGREGRLLN